MKEKLKTANKGFISFYIKKQDFSISKMYLLAFIS